jgi:hypothetical protein
MWSGGTAVISEPTHPAPRRPELLEPEARREVSAPRGG